MSFSFNKPYRLKRKRTNDGNPSLATNEFLYLFANRASCQRGPNWSRSAVHGKNKTDTPIHLTRRLNNAGKNFQHFGRFSKSP